MKYIVFWVLVTLITTNKPLGTDLYPIEEPKRDTLQESFWDKDSAIQFMKNIYAMDSIIYRLAQTRIDSVWMDSVQMILLRTRLDFVDAFKPSRTLKINLDCDTIMIIINHSKK